MRNNVRLTAVLLILATLIGCATNAPRNLPVEAVDDLKVTDTMRSKCPLSIEFVDRRTDPQNLGVIGKRAVIYPDFGKWFELQLRARLRTQESNPDSPKLVVELAQAYMETNRSTLSFNILATVTGGGVKGQLESTAPARVYRGATTKVSWFGNDSETGAFIERAAQELLVKLSTAEEKQCVPFTE